MVSHRRVRQLADPEFKCARVAKAMKAHACMHAQSLSRVQLFATPWTVARQAPLSMARILEWVTISSSRDLPDPGIKPGSPALQADSLPDKLPGTHIYNLLPSYSKQLNQLTF